MDAVVIAVPPRFHLELTLQALAAGKHVLVEKPAYLRPGGLRDGARGAGPGGRVVLVGENDHYKPLAVALRRLLADGVIGDMVFAHFTTLGEAAEGRRRLAQRRADGRRRRLLRGGDPLAAPGRQPGAGDHAHPGLPARRVSCDGPDRRCKSMMVAFEYDNGAVGSLYYSREIPSLLARPAALEALRPAGHHHLRIERRVHPRAGPGLPRCSCRASATSAATRPCIATSRARSAKGGAPEMSLERAIEDQRLMDQVYARDACQALPLPWARHPRATTSSSSGPAPAAARWRTRCRPRRRSS
jgi:hypothetical protein